MNRNNTNSQKVASTLRCLFHKGMQVTAYLNFEIQITDEVQFGAFDTSNISQFHQHCSEQDSSRVNVGHSNDVVLARSVRKGDFDLSLH